MKTVIFKGPLAETYPNGIQLHANSAYEALSLLQNFPEFKLDSGNSFKVHLPKFQTQDVLCQLTDESVIEVVQVVEDEKEFAGAGGKAGVLQIIIGVIIVVANFFTIQNPYLYSAGIGLILGGVVSLLMPQPEKAKNETELKSSYLAANKNTVRIGTTIPLAFGRCRVYGHLLGYNVTATNLNPETSPVVGGDADQTGMAYSGSAAYLGNGGGRQDGEIIYSNDWAQYDGGS